MAHQISASQSQRMVRAARWCAERQKAFDLSSAAGGPTLWGWAILHKAVTPIEIDMLYALIATAHRTGTGLPLPRCLRSVRPRRITLIDVRVDIGLGIRRHPTPGMGAVAIFDASGTTVRRSVKRDVHRGALPQRE